MRFVLIAAFAVLGCAAPRRAALGGECEINSDCDAPLVCRLGYCRNECATSADCAAGLSCVLTGAAGDRQRFGACQLPAETNCIQQSDCPVGLVCRFRQCTNECNEDRDCPGGAMCRSDAMGNACIDAATVPCTLDGDCEVGQFCLGGRCRAECFADRDCRNDFWCELSTGRCRRPPRPPMCVAGEERTASACTDGCSNDADAFIDCDDTDCCGVVRCGPGTLCGDRPDAGPDASTDAGTDAPGAGCGTAPLETVERVAAGRLYVCALAREVGVLRPYCWGDVPGLGRTPCATRIAALDVYTDIEEIDAGGAFTCVRRSTGEVLCDHISTGVFAALAGITAAPGPDGEAVSVGAVHACAITGPSSVHCWGQNPQGQLGDGTRIARPAPVLVTAVDTMFVSDLSAGRGHTCVTRGTERDVECFGDDTYGQLGDGTMGFPLLIGIDTMSAGGEHTVARSGTVYGWGNDSAGQLADPALGMWDDHLALMGLPAGMLGELHAGNVHTCLGIGSEVWCWGNGNAIDGSIGAVAMPTRLFVGVAVFDAGDDFTCGILEADGRVTCVGDGTGGALGDGIMARRYLAGIPVLMR